MSIIVQQICEIWKSKEQKVIKIQRLREIYTIKEKWKVLK